MAQQLSLAGGSVRLWLDQEVVILKAIEPSGDPVELNVDEARQLAHALLALTESIDSQ